MKPMSPSRPNRPQADEAEALRPRSFRRDNYAWLLFIVMTVVAGISWYKFSHREFSFTTLSTAVVTDTPRITILSFDRIVNEPNGTHVSKQQLHEHLLALRDDGFTSITVAQLEAFYRDTRPLPEKPLLLLFEHGYMETYRNVDPLLRELGWHASMGVQTRRLEARDTAFVYWDRLQRMVDSGLWDIVAQGHHTDEAIATTASAELGNFLASRAWLEKPGRTETDIEFAARIEQDFAETQKSFANNLERYQVVAFSYPFGKLDHLTDDVKLRDFVKTAVNGRFKLTLIDDLLGVNDEHSSTQHLNRLRIAPTLSVAELTEHLRDTLRSASSLAATQQLWVRGSGQVERQGGLLSLHGTPHAEVWLAGSQWESDWTLQADIKPQQGEFWLVSAATDAGTQWRFGGHYDTGILQLQSIDATQTTTTLASFTVAPITASTAQTHHLTVTKRGAGVWIEWDHAPLTQQPIYLVGSSRSLLGWKTSQLGGSGGSGQLQIDHAEFMAYPYQVAELSDDPSAAEIQELIAHAATLAAITFPWVNINTDSVSTHMQSPDVMNILARRYGWEVLPTMSVSAAAAMSPEQVAAALQTAIRQSTQGIYLRVDSAATQENLAALIHASQRQAARQNKRLIIASDAPELLRTVSASAVDPEPVKNSPAAAAVGGGFFHRLSALKN